MKTALVAGAAGFIGSHLTDYLLAKGYRVIGVDSFISGDSDNIKHLEGNPNFVFIQHDIRQPLEIKEKLDEIYNLASPASPFDYAKNPIETLQAGAIGTNNLLDLAKEHNARILLTSTSEVYGDPQVSPQSESYWGNVNPIGPRSCYDEAKRYAEALVMAYRRQYGIETRIARIFNTYGPRMRVDDGRVVPAFCAQALTGVPLTVFGDGSQTRSFCYVDDQVEGLYRLMQSSYTLPVNIGNPTEFSIKQFAEKVEHLVRKKCDIEYKELPIDDPKQRRPDITLAKEILKWEPKVDLEKGLPPTIEYFRQKLKSQQRI